jgi:hypothetical protein
MLLAWHHYRKCSHFTIWSRWLHISIIPPYLPSLLAHNSYALIAPLLSNSLILQCFHVIIRNVQSTFYCFFHTMFSKLCDYSNLDIFICCLHSLQMQCSTESSFILCSSISLVFVWKVAIYCHEGIGGDFVNIVFSSCFVVVGASNLLLWVWMWNHQSNGKFNGKCIWIFNMW